MPFGIKFKGEEKITPRKELLPMRIDNFDKLLEKGGVERGSTLMVAGGCGAGKSTFCMDSVYHSILEGERAVYITFEEQASKLRKHMLENFNWDMDKLEKENKFALIRSDPFKIARSVEAFLAERKGDLLVEVQEIQLPFTPDRIIIDSLSALSVAFMGNVENYRYYIRYMFEMLEKYGLVFSGKAPSQPIMQILELPDHPFFVGTQAHPCLTSRPLRPQPMFVGLVAAAMARRYPHKKLPTCIKAVRKVCEP